MSSSGLYAVVNKNKNLINQFILKCKIIVPENDIKFLNVYGDYYDKFPDTSFFKREFLFDPFLDIMIEDATINSKVKDFFKKYFYYFLDNNREKFYFALCVTREGFDFVSNFFEKNISNFKYFKNKGISYFTDVLSFWLNKGLILEFIYKNNINLFLLKNVRTIISILEKDSLFFELYMRKGMNFNDIILFLNNNKIFYSVQRYYPKKVKFFVFKEIIRFLVSTGDIERINDLYVIDKLFSDRYSVGVIKFLSNFYSSEKNISKEMFDYLLSNSESLYNSLDLYSTLFNRYTLSHLFKYIDNENRYHEVMMFFSELFNKYYMRFFSDSNLYKDVIETLLNIILEVDLNGLIEYVNSVFEKYDDNSKVKNIIDDLKMLVLNA